MAHYLKFRGTRYPIRLAETTVGRSAYCPIVLANNQASRQHAKLIFDGSVLQIVDLGSSNGTRVNGTLIQGPHALSSGDIISIGADLLEVEVVADRGSEVPNLADEDDLLADTGRPLGERTSILGSLEYLESLVASARETKTPRKFVTTICGAIDQFLAGRVAAMHTSEGVRLRMILETLRSWCRDGSIDPWLAEVARQIDSHCGPPR